MATSNLMIGIGAEYRGKAAFREAETATQKLTKNVKNLAGAIGIAFSTRAVVNFAKASVKASLEAGAQQDRLAQLLKVTSNASAAQVAVLTEQADALERIGVVSKDSITQVQSQLATFDLSISTI
jgi:AMMECR1 domain-containing protein